jgi:hypothetical protein
MEIFTKIAGIFLFMVLAQLWKIFLHAREKK